MFERGLTALLLSSDGGSEAHFPPKRGEVIVLNITLEQLLLLASLLVAILTLVDNYGKKR